MYMNTKSETKICRNCKNEFTIDSGDFDLYEKFRKGKSDLSGEHLITILPEKSRFPIYTSHEWWGDGWHPMDSGQDYDPHRSFFDQLKELQEKIHRQHQTGENN